MDSYEIDDEPFVSFRAMLATVERFSKILENELARTKVGPGMERRSVSWKGFSLRF